MTAQLQAFKSFKNMLKNDLVKRNSFRSSDFARFAVRSTTKTNESKQARVSWHLGALVAFGMILSGCSGPCDNSWPISGKVTFCGKPVAVGMIRFSNPQAGIDFSANLGPDGAYKAIRAKGVGLPEGTYQVAILPPRINMPVGIGPPPKVPECRDIPAKYRQPSTSGLTLTVKPDVKSFDVNMQQ